MARCRSCNTSRPDEDMTFVTGPSGRFAVCRPAPDRWQLCFRESVMGREVHTLLPNEDGEHFATRSIGHVRPYTPEWDQLLMEAHA